MFKGIAVLFLLPCLALVQAACFDVNVGQNGLSFTPDTITGAKAGDKVNFHFHPGGHGVVLGDAAKACKPGKPTFWSGFFTQQSGIAAKMFTVTLKNADPHYIYCPQITHCQSGMAMVINPPNGKALKAYKAKAGKTVTSGKPAKVGGGKFSKNKNC